MPVKVIHQMRLIDSEKHQSTCLSQKDRHIVLPNQAETPSHTLMSVPRMSVWLHHHLANQPSPHCNCTVEALLFVGMMNLGQLTQRENQSRKLHGMQYN